MLGCGTTTGKSVYSINYDKILESDCSDFIKDLVNLLQEKPYYTVGEFFKTVDDQTLEYLLTASDDIVAENENEQDVYINQGIFELGLLAMILSAAEGAGCDTVEEYHRIISTIVVYTTLTSLDRLGETEMIVHYDQFSFGEDAKENSIIEKGKG